jgi:hypothetical protein
MRPSLGGLLAAVIAAGFGAALLLLVVALREGPVIEGRLPGRLAMMAHRLRAPAVGGRLTAAVLVGVITLVLTRWPVAAVGLAALTAGWPAMFGGHRAERRQIVALEALVMWTEALRDTVTARASLEQSIPATAMHAPPVIRPALIRLVGQLRARVPLDVALFRLSAELDDVSADKVIGALVLNTRQRGTGLAAVLSALAASGRAELDQRRRISAGRASMRRSVQLVVVITVCFAGLLAVFSRAYVAPYASIGGQVALAVVVGLFAASFIWMRRLAGGEAAAPFLNRADARTAQADRRIVHHLTGTTPDGSPATSGRRSAAMAVQR